MRPRRTKNYDGETSWKMSTWKDEVGGRSCPVAGISAVETSDSATTDLVSCEVVTQLISQSASQNSPSAVNSFSSCLDSPSGPRPHHY